MREAAALRTIIRRGGGVLSSCIGPGFQLRIRSADGLVLSQFSHLAPADLALTRIRVPDVQLGVALSCIHLLDGRSFFTSSLLTNALIALGGLPRKLPPSQQARVPPTPATRRLAVERLRQLARESSGTIGIRGTPVSLLISVSDAVALASKRTRNALVASVLSSAGLLDAEGRPTGDWRAVLAGGRVAGISTAADVQQVLGEEYVLFLSQRRKKYMDL